MRCLRTVFLMVLYIVVAGILSCPNEVLAAKVKDKSVVFTAPSSDEKELLEATVNLYCSVKVGNKQISSTGTGVIIDSRGVILTNAHVAQYFLLNGELSKLKADCSVRTGSPAKEKYTAEVLYISQEWLRTNTEKKTKDSGKSTGENDFALLYITEAKSGVLPPKFPALPLGNATTINKGDAVTIVGYPSGNLKYKEIRNKLKVVSETTTIAGLQSFQADTTDIIGLSRTQFASSGVSGGPVIMSKAVIGVIATKSSSKNVDGSSLRALTISYINRALIKEVGLPLAAIYMGDLSTRAQVTRTSLSAKVISAIEKPLRTLR